MKDKVLAALINLFALFCTKANLDKNNAREVLKDYLVRFFSIRNYQEYIDLYDTLMDVYEFEPVDDVYGKIQNIASSIRARIPIQEQMYLVLRLMEFLSQDMAIYRKKWALSSLVARAFGVEQELFEDFDNFIEGNRSKNVGVEMLPKGKGQLRVLRIEKYNTVIVAYDGTDKSIKMNETQMLPGIFVPWRKNGIIKTDHTLPFYYSYVNKLLGTGDTYDPVELVAQDLDFRFPGSKNGLHHFSTFVKSGEFVAIMGGSGVGKTTLLNMLNGTLCPQEGELTINGISLYDNLDILKPHIGYVPQDDLLVEELTVGQNLRYTAKFCFAHLTEEQIDERVDKVLSELGLTKTKDLIVGSPLKKTISGGQRKRLNIALELIREPSILFLDEPTSGLSSSDSEKVIHLLKEQTYKGKLVIVNIHQPSSDVFKLFDRLWLLDVGGYPVYDGNPMEAHSYFKQVAGYVDDTMSVCPTCGNINPDELFSILDARELDSNGEITDVRKKTPKEWNDTYKETTLDGFIPMSLDLPEAIQKKPSFWGQLSIYFHRNMRAKLTNKQFLLISLLEAPALALVVGFLTRYSGEDGYTLYDNKNLFSYMFMSVIVAIFMGMSMNAQEIFKDRSLLKRENFLQLSHGAYLISKIVQAALISALQTFLYILVGNALLSISGMWVEWWSVLFMSSFVAGLTGLFLSQRLNSVVSIYITIPILLIPQILLCGVVVDFDDINQHSDTRDVPLIGEVIPSRWAFEALAVEQYSDNPYSRNFFSDQSDQYELQMARLGYLKELKKQVSWAQHEQQFAHPHWDSPLKMVQNETKKLVDRWGLEPFTGIDNLTAESFNYTLAEKYLSWAAAADKELFKKSKPYTKSLDNKKQKMIDQLGNVSKLIELQTNSCNEHLEKTLANLSASDLVKREGDVLLPDAGIVFLTPESKIGRAPFYSSKKIVGQLTIPTYWYNMAIMAIMAILVMAALYCDKLITKLTNIRR